MKAVYINAMLWLLILYIMLMLIDSQVQIAVRGLKDIAGYPVNMQKRLAKVCWYESYGHNRVIVREGHKPRCFYFVFSGSGIGAYTRYIILLGIIWRSLVQTPLRSGFLCSNLSYLKPSQFPLYYMYYQKVEFP